MSLRTTLALPLVLAAVATTPLRAQLGPSRGLVDVNTVAPATLAILPQMTPALAEAVVAARPFASITELHALLTARGLTAEQATAFYRSAFVHVNLNTATDEELLLIPGVGPRMAHEFEEYRPWRTWSQFDREIGKYVAADEVARLAQYGFIPVNLNTASDEAILSIPGVGPRMLHEFKEYRPYRAMAQFEREIGKYVNEREVARLARYVTIE